MLSSDDESTQKSLNASDYTKDQKSYLFEPWNIKEKDRDLINFQEDCHSYKNFKFPLKAFQMGCFFSETYNSETEETAMTFKSVSDNDIEGIDIKLMVDDNNIKITVGLEDIEYCAVMFHDPFYFLCIKLAQVTCDLYFNELKSLQSAWRDDPDGTLMNGEENLFTIIP